MRKWCSKGTKDNGALATSGHDIQTLKCKKIANTNRSLMKQAFEDLKWKIHAHDCVSYVTYLNFQ